MIGRNISHYRILEKLGGGGMGVVYKAEDTKLERFVALKLLPPELTRDPDAKRRFVHEAKATSALQHHHICTIHEIDETPEGQLFICMDYYEGETLKQKIAKGPFPADDAIDIVSQVADGLVKAHEAGMVHRDIKPANIMVTSDGEVKIVDFGLAKLAGRSKVTKPGITVGTVSYMSPEQAKGDEVDARSDLFSLGVVFYELLTGELPFGGDHESAILYNIMHSDPKPIAKIRNDVPHGLQAIVEKLLLKDPTNRYQSTADMRGDLRREAIEKRPPTDRRNLLRLSIPVAVVLAILLAMLLEPTVRQIVGKLLQPGRLPAEKHIVVLPFENVGGDPANQAFCDGLMETLTSKLTQLEQFHGSLWVVPASEVRQRDINSPSEARRELGINLAFTGSVQRFPDMFRLTLNLIEVDKRAPRQLTSAVFDNNLANISALQDVTVEKMAAMLNVELQPGAQQALSSGGTVVAASYDFYLQARGYLQRYEIAENLDHAVRLFELAIEEDSLFALAYAGLGEAYWRKYSTSRDKKWVERAIGSCNRAYELNDMLAPVRVTLGMIHRGTGEYEKSVVEYKRALDLDPTSPDAYRGLARAYADLQRFDDAETTYKKAIDMKPEYWGGYDDLGLFYYNRGRYEEALTQFHRVVTLTPDNGRGYNHLGAVYYAQELWDEAGRMFMRSIEIEPTYRTYTNLGVLEYIQGRYAESAAMLEKALDLNDKSYVTWANLANAYYWMPGKRDEAYNAYRRAAGMAEELRQINPRDAALLASLAGYYVILGEKDRALSILEQALTIAPNDWWVLYNHGHAYEQLGEREKALDWIDKALKAGYPRKEIERDPWLADLRADERFQQLLRKGVE